MVYKRFELTSSHRFLRKFHFQIHFKKGIFTVISPIKKFLTRGSSSLIARNHKNRKKNQKKANRENDMKIFHAFKL